MSIVTILIFTGVGLVVAAIVYNVIVASKYKGMTYNWYSFKRHGMELGLSKVEIKTLRDIAYNSRLPVFDTIYTSMKTLDRSIIKSVRSIKQQDIPEEEMHNLIENIFLIRNKIDNIQISRKQPIKSTHKLRTNQPLQIKFERIGEYASQVLDNNQGHLAVSIPLESLDVQEFSWKGKKANVAFKVSNDAEYNFTTKVLDQATGAGVGMLHLQHVNKLTRIQKRVYRRNSANISVDIFTLVVSSIGSTRKISVGNPTPFNGLISNISAGGVAIRAGGILKENTLVKLTYSLDFENTDSVIGRVLAYSAIPNKADKMLHIKFERINKKARNRIFEYIYHDNKDNAKNYAPKTIVPGKNGGISPQ